MRFFKLVIPLLFVVCLLCACAAESADNSPSDLVSSYLQVAQSSIDEGNYEKAIAALNEGISLTDSDELKQMLASVQNTTELTTAPTEMETSKEAPTEPPTEPSTQPETWLERLSWSDGDEDIMHYCSLYMTGYFDPAIEAISHFGWGWQDINYYHASQGGKEYFRADYTYCSEDGSNEYTLICEYDKNEYMLYALELWCNGTYMDDNVLAVQLDEWSSLAYRP